MLYSPGKGITAALALVCAGWCYGCAAAADAPAELVLWNLPEKPAPHAPSAARVRKFDLFLAEHPEISVKRGGGPQLQRFGRGTREFLMAQAGGIAPDVIEMRDVDLQDFKNRNFLLPLDDYLREAGMLEEARSGPFARHIAEDGHIYALPMGVKRAALVLVYRRDRFEQVGLDPDKPPTTWAEFLRYAELLTDQPEDRIGFVLPSLETKGEMGAGGFVELVLALNGVEVISRAADGNWVADFAADERAVEALSLIAELIGKRVERDGKAYRGIASTSAGYVDDAIVLSHGEGGMVLQLPGAICWHRNRGLSNREMGMAPVPLGPSGDGFIPLRPPGDRYVGINATCPSEERQRAAWEWIRFHLRPDLRRFDVSAYIDWGWADFVDPRDAAGDEELAAFVADIPAQWAETWRTHAETARPLPMCPQHRQLRQDYLARPFWALLKNPDSDVRELLRQTEEAINKELFGSVPAHPLCRRRIHPGRRAVYDVHVQ